MIHSQRINSQVTTLDRIVKHFRLVSQTLLHEQTPYTGICAGCRKHNCNLELDHANITCDDIIDGFYQCYKQILDKADFRTKDSEKIDEAFVVYQQRLRCIGQWLCHECHLKKN